MEYNNETEPTITTVTQQQEEKKKTDETSYSAKEQELIQQLVQVRLNKKSNLEFESLDDYLVPPRTHFSMLNKPAVSIKDGKMEFNMACIKLFTGVKYILPILSRRRKRLSTIICAEEEISSVEWSRLKKDRWVNKTISSTEFVEDIFGLMEWDKSCRYKVLGRVANSERGLILVFDLSEAIMFSALPEEYIDKKTGEVKKRHNKYFPDIYRDKIGRSYSDYAAAQQLSIFESLSSYTDTSGTEVPSTISEERASEISVDVQAQKRNELLSSMLGDKEDGAE